jgi:hypothetical protein
MMVFMFQLDLRELPDCGQGIREHKKMALGTARFRAMKVMVSWLVRLPVTSSRACGAVMAGGVAFIVWGRNLGAASACRLTKRRALSLSAWLPRNRQILPNR